MVQKLFLNLLNSLRFDLLAIQPDFLTRGIDTTLYSLIVGVFLQLLYMEQILVANLHQFSQLASLIISQAGLGTGVDIFFKQNCGIEAAIEFEWGAANAGILSIVVHKLSY